jgi:hypothetical protein
MTLKFVRTHTDNNGRNYTVGQVADLRDPREAQELIRQGIAQEHAATEVPSESQR